MVLTFFMNDTFTLYSFNIAEKSTDSSFFCPVAMYDYFQASLPRTVEWAEMLRLSTDPVWTWKEAVGECSFIW